MDGREPKIAFIAIINKNVKSSLTRLAKNHSKLSVYIELSNPAEKLSS